MNKFISFSSGLLCALAMGSVGVKPATADHTDDGFFICNYTRVTHGFTMVDSDYNTRKNFSLQPGKCWEYWNYEEIEFVNNFDQLKRYSLQEYNRYRFEYRRDGAIDIVVERY